MDFYVLNFKDTMPSTQQAIAMLEIEIENMQKCGGKAIKVCHGYGSHGVGGAILTEVRKYCITAKKQHKIVDFLCGDEWDLSNSKTQNILVKMKNFDYDEDIGKRNPGITIIVL